jgi:CRISPR-associated protein Cmr3
MNTLLLRPTDVLFFRDGRPMSGSLSGHGAAWPLPTVTNAALHAALHRASIEDVHEHRRGRSGNYSNQAQDRNRKFGSLTTAGPFPVVDGEWLFPRPLDVGPAAEGQSLTCPTYFPVVADLPHPPSSLPKPLLYPVANSQDPSKMMPKPWWNLAAWHQYLGMKPKNAPKFFHDSDFADTESNFGIGIDPMTGTQDKKQFYSAHYLRLRENARLGLLAEAIDKVDNDKNKTRDLIPALFTTENSIIIGGQQRICTTECSNDVAIPFPIGQLTNFPEHHGKFLVKWVLLTPAIFPAINSHSGGWLPSWIDISGQVQLLDGPGKNFVKRHGGSPGQRIPAKLVAALTGKPLVVTGYALESGPKPTLLAVPPGSTYYFECTSAPAAETLAAALNWHGNSTAMTTIRNRRSTLMGEKGFGLGVCSNWMPHQIS